jgi:hypothetical protein
VYNFVLFKKRLYKGRSMMRYALLSLLLVGGFAINNARAAIFYVHNKTRATVYLRPIWSGKSRTHDRLEPGQHIRYNSYFWNVSAIHWLEQAPTGDGTLVFKAFEQQVSLGFLNLGGEFNILSDGSFDYHFGVDGMGDGSAPQVNEL